MRAAIVVGLALGCGSIACAELPDFQVGTCGNGVLEAGEDCDTAASGCGQPETVEECRFLCGQDLSCPAGYGCGADGVCRAPSGSFEQSSELSAVDVLSTTIGDFDGDGVLDLLSTNVSTQSSVTYLDSGANPVAETSFSSEFTIPAVGQLSSDVAADVVDVSTRSVNVLRGQSDRSLKPTPYSSIPVADLVSTYVALEARPDAGGIFSGDEILRFEGPAVISELDGAPLFNLPFDSSELSGPVVTGNIDARINSVWDEFVLAKYGGKEVLLLTPTTLQLNPPQLKWNKDPGVYPAVKLPPGFFVAGPVFVADANSDGALDLMVTALPDGSTPGDADQFAILAAFGQFEGVGGKPNGTFHSDGKPTTAPDGTFGKIAGKLPAAPLAVGHLDGDGQVDAVFPNAIALSGVNVGCELPIENYNCFPNQGDSWTAAEVGDFNGTGGPDIIAASAGSRSVVFLNNTGQGGFSVFTIPTTGFVDRLVTGDFDGDFVTDVALVEFGLSFFSPSGSGDTPPEDTVSVMFGRAFGPPEAPVSLGNVGIIEGIISGRLDFLEPDILSDIGVLSRKFSPDGTSTRSVAIFEGNTNRQLSSPFRLLDSPTDDIPDFATRSVVTRRSASEMGVAVLALAVDVKQGKLLQARPWMLPTSGDAAIAENQVTLGAYLPPKLDMCGALVVPADLNDDGIEELVLLSREQEGLDRKGGAGQVLSLDGSGTWVESQGMTAMPLAFSAPPGDRLTCEFTRAFNQFDDQYFDGNTSGRAVAADLDGVPGIDVLAMGFAGEEKYELALFRNVGGALDLAAPTVLAVEGSPLRGFGLVQADTDPHWEIVLLTDAGVDLAELDVAGQRVQRVSRIVTLGGDFGGSGPGPAPTPGTGFGGSPPFGMASLGAPYFAAESGDVDGDGVQDLVLGINGTLRIFNGRPTR